MEVRNGRIQPVEWPKKELKLQIIIYISIQFHTFQKLQPEASIYEVN